MSSLSASTLKESRYEVVIVFTHVTICRNGNEKTCNECLAIMLVSHRQGSCFCFCLVPVSRQEGAKALAEQVRPLRTEG